MPAPSFLNTGAAWDSDVSSDVQTAIYLFDDIVTAQLAVADRWTAAGGGVYESPVQEPAGAARKMSITLTRASATVLQFLVKDQNAQTVFDGEIHLSGSTSIKVFAGPRHAVIQFFYGATYELALASMCDPSPQPLSVHHLYVAAKTNRDNAGVAVTGATVSENWVMRDAWIGSGHVGRMSRLNLGPGGLDGRTSGGSNMNMHADIGVQPSAATRYGSAGKLTQLVLASNVHPPGSVIDIPISDGGGVGSFEVLGLDAPSSGYIGRLAVRRSAP